MTDTPDYCGCCDQGVAVLEADETEELASGPARSDISDEEVVGGFGDWEGVFA